MLVASLSGGLLAQWARTTRPALAQSVAPGLPVSQTEVGGRDGVTDANEFGVGITPDGHTVLHQTAHTARRSIRPLVPLWPTRAVAN